MAPLRNSDFRASSISPMILDERQAHQRADLLVEIVAVDLVDLGGDLDRKPAPLGNPNGAIDRFLRRDAPQKRQITRPYGLRGEQMRGQAVVDRLDPAGLRHRPPLGIRNRYHRHRRKRCEHRLVLGQIEAAVQSRDEGRRLAREQRKRIVVQMEMHDVEVVGLAPNLLQHRHVQSHRVPNRTVETQSARPDCFELRGGVGISAGEQRDVVSEATSSSVSHEITRSVPPYNFGGTASVSGDICAIRMHTPDAARLPGRASGTKGHSLRDTV